MFFDRKITFFELEVDNQEDALKKLADNLYTANLVTSSFHAGILEREKDYPTGLGTVPYGVAIPHTNADKVIIPQIAFASLKSPVKFRMMGSQDEEVDVSVIFMLALNKAEDQLAMLQKLMEVIENQALLTEFARCKNQDEFEKLLERIGLE
ncbi:hypothetical protein A8F94_08090 [Bacillus sp. FJAT-27225]|uniref:PTS sugar transporter subunit IIA n=1 Tax=Bacillus sp. FJAT-27225 TaxID=1743144 RepID=UPI00080C3554|nr:PTS sugar transporter subunit IIA [Bacillus sp. FJAT-27225]OCA87793.1 hypothetical protein A8F94_08090 [Bacillus sp. FJAT-27225]